MRWPGGYSRTAGLWRLKAINNQRRPSISSDYQPCEQGRRIELTHYRFEITEAARHRMQRKNIAIAGRGQGHEAKAKAKAKAKVNHLAGERRIILKRHSRECIGNEQANKRI